MLVHVVCMAGLELEENTVKFETVKEVLSYVENIFTQSEIKVSIFVTFCVTGHQRPDNIPATEAEECCPKDTTAGEQQVGRRAVDCQCSSGGYHVIRRRMQTPFLPGLNGKAA